MRNSKFLLTSLLAAATMSVSAYAELTTVANMSTLVNAGTVGADVTDLSSKYVSGNTVYDFGGTNGITGITTEDLSSLMSQTSGYITVAAWVRHTDTAQDSFFSYGDQSDGFKLDIKNNALSVTTKGVADKDALGTVSVGEWTLVAISLNLNTSGDSRYLIGESDYWTRKLGSWNTPSETNQVFGIGTGNGTGDREVFTGQIANLTIFSSDTLATNAEITALMGTSAPILDCLIWNGNSGEWNTSAMSWTKSSDTSVSVAFALGDSVKFATADATITLGESVSADEILVAENTTFVSANDKTLSAAVLTVDAGKKLTLDGGISNYTFSSLSGTGAVRVTDASVDSAGFAKVSAFTGTLEFAGAVDLGSDALSVGATRTFEGGLTTTGNVSVSSAGVLNLGGTSNLGAIRQTGGEVNVDGVTTTVQFVGTSEGATAGTLNIGASGVLTVTGDSNSTGGNQGSFQLAHWGAKQTVNVSGVLNLQNCGISNKDGNGDINILSGGEVNFNAGFTVADANNNAGVVRVTLNEGGRINIGGTSGIPNSNVLSLTLNGGKIGSLVDSWSSAQAMTIGGAVTFDTAKRSFNATGKAAETAETSAVTIGAINFADAGSLDVIGGGSLTLNGVITGVAVDSEAKITVSGGSLVLGSGLVFALTGEDDSIIGKTLNIATLSGGTISGSLAAGNFTWNGSALSGRTQVSLTDGIATFSGEAYNLFWKSGATTWNASTEFDKDSVGSGTTATFVTGDNVTFGAGDTATVTFSDALVAGRVSIEGNVTLASTITGTLTAQDGIVVADGGTLIVAKGNDGSSAIRGSLTVQSGGTARFDIKDVCGWSAGRRLEALTVDSGGSLVINQNGNETFCGTLTLNGTMSRGVSGGDSTRWDLYGGSAKIVTTAADAKIEEGVKIQLRQNNSEIQVAGTNATLEIASTVGSSAEGNGLLRKTGTGTLILSGENSYTGGTNIEAGALVAKKASALGSGAGNVTISNNAELRIDIGVDATMTQGAGTISSAEQNQSAKLTIASGKLVLTSATNNFRGTVDILSGGVLELGSTAKLLTQYSNTSKIFIRTGGELRLDNFTYDQLGASPDYAVHRQIDGGRLSITGATSASGQSFTVTANGGEFLMEQAGQTLTLNGNANSEIIALGGALKLGGAGDIVINKYGTRAAIVGSGSLEKVGEGTLTINSAGNTYTGGTIVSKGVLVVGAADALGTNSVRVAGGQLKVRNVTLNQTAITVVLGEAYKTNGGVAALVGESGSLATGTTVTVDATDLGALGLVAGVANEYSIWDSTLTTDATLALSEEFERLLAADGWEYAVFGGVLTISSIPEPSVFGLLAGLGALALAGTRRRRRK
ncbi:beta strand repeat-containing protein [Candidatus Spyradosoma sp. SGI.093]|uniref:beta strand repeat-containing protein n=1 Tax=Candidatus Spyradosoma sp. SGI.093 TaxID=3420583 RepID=UPI003D06D074